VLPGSSLFVFPSNGDGIYRASQLKKVQKKLGCPRAALGILSDAVRVFDSDLLRGIIGDLTDQLQPLDLRRGYDQIHGVLTLVDASPTPPAAKSVDQIGTAASPPSLPLQSPRARENQSPAQGTVDREA